MSKTKGFLFSVATAVAMVFTANAFAQGMDTAYVPFSVNVNATATAQLAGGGKFEKPVRSGYTDTLLIVTKGESTPLARQGKTPSPVTMYSSRGKISLELSRQLYRSTDIALYSLNGKQILHGKAAVSEAVKSISHPNVAMGVYLLSVKGVNGGTFTTRFAHTGGGLNIDVAFANGSSGSLMEKAISGNWVITVSAEGYLDTSYAFVPEIGRGNTLVQEIALRQTSSSSSSGAEPSSSSTFLSRPNSPTNVKTTGNSESSIIVNWEPVTGAAGYYIYRNTTDIGTYDSVGTSATTSYTDNSLSSGTIYYYRVAAYNSEGTSNQSSYTSAITLPGVPANVTATVNSESINSESSITVSWESVIGARGYYIYRSTTADGTYDSVGISATTSYANNYLLSNTTYYYKVAAYHGVGTGNQSEYASATTLLSTPSAYNLRAIANSENSIIVSWYPVTGATGYHIYRSTTADGTYDSVGTSATTSYEDNSLSVHTRYYYKVAAYNSGGIGRQSAYFYAAILPAPTDVTATANSESSITVSWGSVTGATGYRIYRSTTADGTYDIAGSSGGLSYTDNSLSANTTYYYKVATWNNSGIGTQSDYASAKTLLGVPIGVTATANSENSITVSWGSVTGTTGYYIYRYTTSTATYDSIGTSATTSYTDNSLSAGTYYWYKVAAYNDGGRGTQSDYTGTATLPDAPTKVWATANSNSIITVSWESVIGASGYYIYRSTTADGTYDLVGTSATTSCANGYLLSNTTYYYKIVAYNDGGRGTQSEYAFATTPLSTPTGVTAMANSESSIIVNWESVTGTSGYYVFRSTTYNGTYDSIGTSATTSYEDNSLSGGTRYYYKVAAYNSGGTSTQSSYVSAITPLGTPTGVTATVNSERSITVSWEPVTGATWYYIYRSTTTDGTYTRVVGISAGRTSYEDNYLSGGTTYYYKVAANVGENTSTQSSYVSAITQPGTPTGVTATANSESSITVSWESVKGATGYYIYRSTTYNGTYDSIGTSATTSYEYNSLSGSTRYYYKVAAYNGGGTGTQSSYVFAITQPSTPTGVTATANSESSIIVSWESVIGATGYRIYRSTTADGTYDLIGTSATTPYADNSLLSGTAYYYKVAAYNGGGTGTQSSYVSAITQPSTPTGVTATANSESSITVSWESVIGATGYRIYRSTTYNGTYDSIGTSATTSYEDNSLSGSTRYYYKVAAYNGGGTGTQSSYVFAVVQPIISCSMASTGYEGAAITRPEITCSDGSVPSGIVLSGQPYWDNPVAGNYEVYAEANCGFGALPATFCGTLIVNEVTLTCATVPVSGISGIAIIPPALTCSNGKTAASIAWTNAPTWGNPAYGAYSNIKATATCGTSVDLSANCSGTLNVSCSGYDNTSTHYCSNSIMKAYNSVTYNGQTYKTVVIGTQIWMAENLNYNPNTGNSVCYDGLTSNCNKYGRLYDWSTAMNLQSSCNGENCSVEVLSKHRGICPPDWHIPNDADWDKLFHYVDGTSGTESLYYYPTVGRYLKATSGWNRFINGANGNGTDQFGFSALPGGCSIASSHGGVGSSSYWWSATERSESILRSYAYTRTMHYGDEGAYRNDALKPDNLLSVRCLQD